MEAIMLLVFLAPDTDDAAMRREIGRLEGTWKVAAAEFRGKKMDRPPFERVVFAAGKGDNAAGMKGARVFRYQIDPGKSPKVIEGTGVGDGAKRQGIVGIYEVGEDTLKLCIVRGGKKAPAEFKTGPDDEAMVLELKRDKK
jgi:uncharacterized protein (TIGR03067 family)